MRPIVLSIAGFDPCAGAGIQADLKAIEAQGAYAATVVTALTVQNTLGVRDVDVLKAEWVRAQLEAVIDDLPVAAVKSGMLGDAAVVAVVGAALEARPWPYVLDPVLAASSGFRLLDAAGEEALRRDLIPRARLLTPNAPEAAALSGCEVLDPAGAERAARALLELGAGAVLVKGGHLARERGVDLLLTRDGTVRRFAGPWIDTPHTHGTGCVLSAAIAALLARGLSLEAAIGQAKQFVVDSLRAGLACGRGVGPLDPLHALHAGRPAEAC